MARGVSAVRRSRGLRGNTRLGLRGSRFNQVAGIVLGGQTWIEQDAGTVLVRPARGLTH
jgi:hypothetical protein